ncbi:Protein disulfide-isomerase domain-containing protein, variant 2 [Trichophyton interdigitale]|uniref:Protein disulfide-isomerase n=1 Tax=Trichophyton interdigitale TaxID=101480 RepID=A0A9P4YF36_9EURO|nr:Protein disulfide-isomerase domain-containing protein, variant 2 [Trichophyton interdigitale]KAF3896008.1 Protein disulfide-isomerase domain-containing protein, variant 2 [Trichophyton interdigitale]KAG8207600.1 Protein disulfide-isomerase domain-containing protein, variant 2 [Trichophyton interdigitale]
MPGVRSLLLALAGVSLAPAVLAADASTDSSDVHVLKTDTFKDFIKEHDLVLAEFYAPWCGHCKALAPEYEKAATELKSKNIQLAKVDCTEEADLCQEYGVEGYPTLKVFRGLDSYKPYNGARKSPAITSYMIKQSLPSVSVVTADNFEEVKSLDKVVVVAFIGEDDKETNTTYTALADSMRDDVLFAGTNSADLAKKEGVSLPAVVLYKEFDDRKDIYDGKFEADAIKAFIKSASTPLVGEVGPETYSGYMSAGIPLAYIFADTAEEREQYAADFKDLAKKLKGKINFATIDSKAFGAHSANLNLIPEKFPAFAIQDTVSNKKYPFDQEKKLTKEEITKFVEGVIAGDIAPSVKSEAIPEANDGPVTVIVAHTYEEIVMNKDKDVLVEFYAPWCGHCKALAPKYDQLGGLYKDNKDFASKVTIAKVDATANDIPDEIQGFPTIKLFPAGAKDKPVEYTGSRTIEDLANFVRDNGKHKVDAYDEKKIEKDGSDVTGKPKNDEAPPKPSDAPESEEKADKEHEEL